MTRRPVSLEDDLKDVTVAVNELSAVVDQAARESLTAAAKWHDCGKADVCFQALLHGGDPTAAQFARKLLAKGGQTRQSPAVRQSQWRRSGLPDDSRHELVSLLLVQKDSVLSKDELALHLNC